ncbi:MAG TPA: hypothetical protein GXZ46_03995, partial [Actinomycetales bacterium]|nr:hypothetical protein [Actinomycetales bacterium]
MADHVVGAADLGTGVRDRGAGVRLGQTDARFTVEDVRLIAVRHHPGAATGGEPVAAGR